MLKKSVIIISLVKNRNYRYLKKTHKFGVDVLNSISRAYALDKNNGNTLWEYSISKEMKYVIPAFRKLYNWYIVPIGYQSVNNHIIFDVKMEDFRRKDRLLAGEYVTYPPSIITYANVVSREIVRVDFSLATTNDFPGKVGYIQNSYITEPVT